MRERKKETEREEEERVRLCEKYENKSSFGMLSLYCWATRKSTNNQLYTLIIECVRNSKVKWIENTATLMIYNNDDDDSDNK